MTPSAESGQSMTEYAVILTVIAVAITAAFAFLGGAVDGLYQDALSVIGSLV